MLRLPWFTCALLCLGACQRAEDTATLLIDLQTDLIGGVEFAAVEVELLAQAVTTDDAVVLGRQEQYATTRSALPLRIGTFVGLPLETATVRVRLRDYAGVVRLERVAVVEVQSNTTATVTLTRDCAGLSCPEAGDTADAIACLGGRCVDPRCLPEAPDFCPEGECTEVSDCPSVDPCAEARCDFGVCIPVVRPLTCTAGSYCQPELGCLPTNCPQPNGAPCDEDIDCIDTCIANLCSPPQGVGGPCESADDCIGLLACQSSQCEIPPLGPPRRFNGTVSFPAGAGAGRIAFGDINNDGDLDAVVANQFDDTFSVLFGRGDGSFINEGTIPAGSQAYDIALGDFDEDGNLDVAVTASGFGDSVDIFFGGGDGTFVAGPSFATGGPDPLTVLLADLNNDGHLDAVAPHKGGVMTILMGAGDGTFAATEIAGAAIALSGAIADFNDDGTPDVVIGWHGLDTYLGVGDGSFQTPISLPLGFGASVLGIATADVNEDGNLDLVTVVRGSLRVFAGMGDGSFSELSMPPSPLGTLADGTPPVADLDGDGHLDVLVPVESDNVSVLFRGIGDGTFVLTPNEVQAAFVAFSGNLIDLNGDGFLDSVTAGLISAGISIVFGAGDLGFPARPTLSATGLQAATLGDLNGDGNIDAVAAITGDDEVAVFWGSGNGTFPQRTNVAASGGPRNVAVADFNGDGTADLLTVNETSDDLSVFLAAGAESFLPALSTAVGRRPVAAAVAQMNGDAALDVVAVNYDDGTVQVLLGTGNGGFSAGTPVAVSPIPASLALGDVNGDGNVDVVVAGSETTTLLGDGAGNLTRAGSTSNLPRTITLGDVTGDGTLDLVAREFGGSVNVFVGAGDGSFPTMASTLTAPGNQRPGITALPADLLLHDLNGDGALDLAVPGDQAIYLGQGDGTFVFEGSYAGSAFDMEASDLNGDGLVDLVGASADPGELQLMLQNP